jgi:AcrR family transcriptional regulator
MKDVGSQRERVNQKRRTRAVLVEAAQRLLEQGRTPTVAEVADEALVSRATAYRYLPSQEHLLLEVVLKRSIDDIDDTVKAATRSENPEQRVDGLVRAINAEVAANEAGFRSLLALSLARARIGEGTSVAEIRGMRRIGWIEHVLAPLRGQLDDVSFQRLVSALALCMGAEAHFVLRDLRGLQGGEIDDTLRWAVQALLMTALREHTRGTSS